MRKVPSTRGYAAIGNQCLGALDDSLMVHIGIFSTVTREPPYLLQAVNQRQLRYCYEEAMSSCHGNSA